MIVLGVERADKFEKGYIGVSGWLFVVYSLRCFLLFDL